MYVQAYKMSLCKNDLCSLYVFVSDSQSLTVNKCRIRPEVEMNSIDSRMDNDWDPIRGFPKSWAVQNNVKFYESDHWTYLDQTQSRRLQNPLKIRSCCEVGKRIKRNYCKYCCTPAARAGKTQTNVLGFISWTRSSFTISGLCRLDSSIETLYLNSWTESFWSSASYCVCKYPAVAL